MGKDSLRDKRILAVDENWDVLDVMTEKILGIFPDCQLERATTYPQAMDLMISKAYDLMIIAFPEIQGQNLLNAAMFKKIPVIFLSAFQISAKEIDRLRKKG